MLKRTFDLLASLLGLLLLGWLILALALLVRATSPGPGLFRQTRVGRHRRPFTCYKLRTMAADTRVAPTHEVSAASVTPLGRRLRRWKLDELPQLWNVLRGEMSLVGPRPCLPIQTALIAERERLGVFAVRPGITGPAQVMGVDMSDPVRLAAIDAAYAREHDVLGDLRLLLATLSGRGAADRVAP